MNALVNLVNCLDITVDSISQDIYSADFLKLFDIHKNDVRSIL